MLNVFVSSGVVRVWWWWGWLPGGVFVWLVTVIGCDWACWRQERASPPKLCGRRIGELTDGTSDECVTMLRLVISVDGVGIVKCALHRKGLNYCSSTVHYDVHTIYGCLWVPIGHRSLKW